MLSGLLSACVVACSGKPAAPAGTPPAASATPSSSESADSGTRIVNGMAPAASGSYPSIVLLEPIGGADPSPQGPTPVMDQVQQTFIPPILLVRTGQPVDFLNNDDVLHNVRVRDSETRASAFNVEIPRGEKFRHVFTGDGFYDVGCDIHPGMSAQIVASGSPYSAVADTSGAFQIAGVPNGPYKAVAYAGAQKIEREVTIAAGMSSLDLTHP